MVFDHPASKQAIPDQPTSGWGGEERSLLAGGSESSQAAEATCWAKAARPTKVEHSGQVTEEGIVKFMYFVEV